MNVLLVYPKYPDTFWSFKHALPFVGKKSSFVPLGLLTVAQMLPKHWSLKLLNMNIRKLRRSDLAWADLVMISAMIVQKSSTDDVIRQCRQAGKPIVAGGPLFTNMRDAFPDVNYLVLNEAELTLPDFLRDFEAGKAKRVYETLEYPDIRSTPVPRWDLVDLNEYAAASIQFSRGCPFNCDFCNVTALFGRKVRTKSAAQIVEELNEIYRYFKNGPIFFVDDNLIGHRKAVREELLPTLIEWKKDKPGIKFNTEVSIDLADDSELIAQMVQAGFETVFVGIETTNEQALTDSRKHQNSSRNLIECVKTLQRAGLQVQAGFIVGFDSDEPSIFSSQIEFIQKSGIVTAMVGMLHALPGTALYRRMQEEGRLLGDSSGDNADGSTNFVTSMDMDKLSEGYKRILKNIYSPDLFYERIKTFLLEYKPPVVRSPITYAQVMAFFRSVFRLGICGVERKHYWQLVRWTRKTRPELLPQAVTLAVYGYHFRRVCELQVF